MPLLANGVVRNCAVLVIKLLSWFSSFCIPLLIAPAHVEFFLRPIIPCSPRKQFPDQLGIIDHLQRKMIIYFRNVAMCDAGIVLGRVLFICTGIVQAITRRRDHRPPELPCWSSYCEKTTQVPG